jgi:hypothetical protein
VTLNATTSNEIDAAFAGFARDRPDALFVAPDVFFNSRRDQFSDLAAPDRIPASYDNSGFVVRSASSQCAILQIENRERSAVATCPD